MVYIYRGNKYNLFLERIKRNKGGVIKVQSDGYNLPVLKCSNSNLSFIFSSTNNKFRHAVQLNNNETVTVPWDEFLSLLNEDIKEKKLIERKN